MEVKTKEDWLYQFRRCSSRETLEKVISHTRYKLTLAELEAFNSAVDHRLAELTIAFRLLSGNMLPERSVITAVLCRALYACDSFALLWLLQS